MYDIFLSYTEEDIEIVQLIVNALEKKGFSVWWDRKIPPGKIFDNVIENAINASKCVIVLWSDDSVKSRWVKIEAHEGYNRNILIPVLIKKVEIPFAFKFIQAANLINWGNNQSNPDFISLVNRIHSTIQDSEKDSGNSTGNTSPNPYLKDFNIYVDFPDGSTKQITFNESDENPVFVDNYKSIVFTRNYKERGQHRVYTRKKLMIVSVDDLKETLITERKPYKDGNDNSDEIFRIINPTVSIDGKHIYFSTEKWATEDQVVKVNIENGKWTELFPGVLLEYIRNGDYRGSFLIVKSEIRDEGRAGYYMIVDEKGSFIKDFKDKKSAEAFMKTINNSY